MKINSQKDKYLFVNSINNQSDLIYKARQFALLAISTYNNPYAEFRVYGYIVNVVIAWTSLLHAIFEKEKKLYFYTDRNSKLPQEIDGDKKAWDLSKCIDEYWKGIESPVKYNLDFLIMLRNKIEHRLIFL